MKPARDVASAVVLDVCRCQGVRFALLVDAVTAALATREAETWVEAAFVGRKRAEHFERRAQETSGSRLVELARRDEANAMANDFEARAKACREGR